MVMCQRSWTGPPPGFLGFCLAVRCSSGCSFFLFVGGPWPGALFFWSAVQAGRTEFFFIAPSSTDASLPLILFSFFGNPFAFALAAVLWSYQRCLPTTWRQFVTLSTNGGWRHTPFETPQMALPHPTRLPSFCSPVSPPPRRPPPFPLPPPPQYTAARGPPPPPTPVTVDRRFFTPSPAHRLAAHWYPFFFFFPC